MVGAARGRTARSGEAGDANVVSGHIKRSATVDPSAVQGITGGVSENSRLFFVVSQPLDVIGCLSPALSRSAEPAIISPASHQPQAELQPPIIHRRRLLVRLGAVPQACCAIGLRDAGVALHHRHVGVV
jgi:hypothetical protein